MKKGTGKIIAGALLGIIALGLFIDSAPEQGLFCGILATGLLVWGWLQWRNPEVQKKFEERQQRRKAEYERLRAEMQLKKEQRQKEKDRLQEERQLQERHKRREKRLQEEYKFREKRNLAEYEQKLANFSIEGPQLLRIIQESIGIINKTKNIDTAISRFDLIKQQMHRFFEIAPAHSSPSFYIFGAQITTPSDILLIDDIEKRWIYSYFKDKIDTELSKVDMMTDERLKNAQLKKALKIALKSLDYLSDNNDMRRIIHSLEERLSK